MREFGKEEKKPAAPTTAASSIEAAEPIKLHTPAQTQKAKKQISDDTMVFSPIRSEQLSPDLEAPMKIASDGKLPSAKLTAATPELAKKTSRRERKAARERKLIGEIKDCIPLTAQEQLKECRKGLGMRHLRVILLTLPVLAGLFLLLYQESNWSFLPIAPHLNPWLPLTLLLLSVLLSYDVFISAFLDLIHLRIGLHTLTCICVPLTVYLSFVQQTDDSQTYCAITSLLLLSQLRALHSQRVALFHTLRTVCSFDAPMGIYDAPKLLENVDSLRRDSGNVPDFLEKLEHKNRPNQIFRVYSSILILLAPALAYLISISTHVSLLEALLLLLLCAVPCGAALSYARPFASISKYLSGYKGALCGWYGAKIFGGKHTIVLSDEDLFPKKNITSNGMKLYGSYKAPRIIAYALAALKLVDSPLVELFQSLLEAQYGKHFPVTQHRIYEDGGIGAEIAGDIVLVGSLSFMRSMGVHMPAGTRVRQAVYMSVGGELAGIFAVKYKPSTSTRAGLRDILANRNFSIILATRDFLISPELIAAKYELPTDSMHFPDYSERLRLADISPEQSEQQGALIAKDTFGAFAVTVAAGRTLRLSTVCSLGLTLFAGILGLLLCACILAWNAVSVASPLHIAAFQLLWTFLSSFVSFIILKF